MDIARPPDFDSLINIAIGVGGESVDFDFKEIRDLDKFEDCLKLVKTITGFANSENGGYIFIGVTDNGEVKGLELMIQQQYDQTRIKGLLRRHISPVPRVQVHKHSYDGRFLVVIIRVEPFDDVPHVVVSGSTGLAKGTFVVRTLGAESAPIDSETELRRLCDVIVRRKATSVVDLIQRGLLGSVSPLSSQVPGSSHAEKLAEKAVKDWTSETGEGLNYLEVFFEPVQPLVISRDKMQSLISNTSIKLRHDDEFPPYIISGNTVADLKGFGWTSRLPTDLKIPAWYLWYLVLEGGFLYRQRFWEDDPLSVIPHGVGVYHVIEQLILLVRFLDRFSKYLDLDNSQAFRLGIRIVGARGRYLANELDAPFNHPTRFADEDRVSAEISVSIGELRTPKENRTEVVATLAEQIAWGMNRTDLTRKDLLTLAMIANIVNLEYQFPEQEQVKKYGSE